MTRTLAIFAVVLTLTSHLAHAQLVPERLYYGVGQRVPILVQTPDDFAGEIAIELIDPENPDWTRSAPAARGRVDLTSLLPVLWEDKPHRVIYAQLILDGEQVGSPLVIQPIITPERGHVIDPSTLEPSTDPRAPVMFDDKLIESRRALGQNVTDREVTYSGLRIYPDKEVVMSTSEGDIVFRMRPDSAPNTAFNFMHLVEGGFYTNVIFHRVVAALPTGAPFVIQVGDLSGTGSGGPGYMIDLENSDLPHDFGVLSMARDSDPDTNGSQVFVALSREGTSFLDGRYTSFAEAVSGQDAIRKIASVPVNPDDRPLDPPMILSSELRDAPPYAQRPAPLSTLVQDGSFERTEPTPARTEPDR